MAIQSRGLAFEVFPSQKNSGHISPARTVADAGLAFFPSCRISTTPPHNYISLSAAFSEQCSLAPTPNTPAYMRHSRWRSRKCSPVSSISSEVGKTFRVYHAGRLSVGKRKLRQCFLISSASRGCCASTCALSNSRFELERRRFRSTFFRILKLATPICMSWSTKKTGYRKRGAGRASGLGMRCSPTVYRWPSSVHKFFVVISSSVSCVESSHTNSTNLFRAVRIFRTSADTGYGSSISSVRSQAEGHALPEKIMLAEDVLVEKEQTWSSDRRHRDFLATGYGWRVRDAVLHNLQELMRVADIQTDSFHITAAAFDDLFYKLFHAEVLSSLQYKARHSPPDRYSCLLAEKDVPQERCIEEFDGADKEQTIVGAVDVTALMDSNIVSLLPGAYEYLYISGMAVDAAYRRRSVATLLLEACVVKASDWGFKYLVLHAYEDDIGARNLYSRAGFRTVGGDPLWMTKFLGRRRRVVMARRTIEVSDLSS